jgi:hypothetical protein
MFVNMADYLTGLRKPDGARIQESITTAGLVAMDVSAIWRRSELDRFRLREELS